LDFPERITIILVEKDTSIAIPDIAIQIKLYAGSHNDYCFVPDRSDGNGRIIIEKEWLREQIHKDMCLFIMDYKSSLEECAPRIEIEVLNAGHIKKMIASLCDWMKIIPYVKSEIETLEGCSNSRYKALKTEINIENGQDTFTVAVE
jgi:hypothetical protein